MIKNIFVSYLLFGQALAQQIPSPPPFQPIPSDFYLPPPLVTRNPLEPIKQSPPIDTRNPPLDTKTPPPLIIQPPLDTKPPSPPPLDTRKPSEPVKQSPPPLDTRKPSEPVKQSPPPLDTRKPSEPIKQSPPLDTRKPLEPSRKPSEPSKQSPPLDRRKPLEPVKQYPPRKPLEPVRQSPPRDTRKPSEPSRKSSPPPYVPKNHEKEKENRNTVKYNNSHRHFEDDIVEFDDEEINDMLMVTNTIITSSNKDLSISNTLVASGATIFETPLVLLDNSTFIIDSLSQITVQSITSQGVIHVYPDSVLNVENILLLNNSVDTLSGVSGTLNLFDTSFMKGSGTIDCVVYNNGTIAPGFSPGMLYVSGLVLHDESILSMEIEDNIPGYYDVIISNGPIILGGALLLDFSGYQPQGTDTITLLYSRYANITGVFDSFAVVGLSSNFFCSMQHTNNEFSIIVNVQPADVPQVSSPKQSIGMIVGIICASVFVVIAIKLMIKYRKKKNQEYQYQRPESNETFYINPLKVQEV